mmetsp:Transcript_26847/g.61809  ORF Transcript_26847/g.61809 Transcript_26847/m.61809 type:complete len:626 (-) Transcript_26847:481-2358(-)|eukprot:CAMPEP_0113314248 /NCGR_PEP_ID=MMETSP0010_2-20120614/10383_1 /TAXON_ID=216773 ORGANISM="Corethron hystrix, Strain 308" /NCGR_SAMPLE_ID=MMETSP0010_2 /ASSEMBLY_ACC=CAM_ASM_000155 /LENGTH=625 /DNA_ID=CAMNT_0000170493 /DNA_START=254 /DNA_END=2131 /DNA_ORIENTATION=+ /assembly_acc=CAM_ASM_000155
MPVNFPTLSHFGRKSDPYTNEAKDRLPWISLFIGELRDGLAMINMQTAYLINAKGFSDAQISRLSFLFGTSQFLAGGPAGWIFDRTDRKIRYIAHASVITTVLTVMIPMIARENGKWFWMMAMMRCVQGCCTGFFIPGLNAITQGIVGADGMTKQVSRNKMMAHLGTAILMLSSGMVAYYVYPNVGFLFLVAPAPCLCALYQLSKIRPGQIDHYAARGLVVTATPSFAYNNTNTLSSDDKDSLNSNTIIDEYGVTTIFYHDGLISTSDCDSESENEYDNNIDNDLPREIDITRKSQNDLISSTVAVAPYSFNDAPLRPQTTTPTVPESTQPKFPSPPPKRPAKKSISFRNINVNGISIDGHVKWLGERVDQVREHMSKKRKWPHKRPTFKMLRDPTLLILSFILFLFNLANSTILPLVMKTLSVKSSSGRQGIFLSSMCICIAQLSMFGAAKYCGDYSPKYGRKYLFTIGLCALPVRCLFLSFFGMLCPDEGNVSFIFQFLFLSTQVLDGIGNGIVSTMQLMVVSDISASTGRFALNIGVTSSVTAFGSTMATLMGPRLSRTVGVDQAYAVLGCISLIPALMYTYLMKETMPDYAKEVAKLDETFTCSVPQILRDVKDTNFVRMT